MNDEHKAMAVHKDRRIVFVRDFLPLPGRGLLTNVFLRPEPRS
jgi:hypothetical protein